MRDKSISAANPKQILVIQLRQLGDILLTTPCLRAIKRAYPQATLAFLSHAMGRLIIDGSPDVDEHFIYADDWTALQEWRLARQLRERQYDLVIDFMNNPRSAFYTWMTGAPERWAFRSARRPAYTHVTAKPETAHYIVDEKFSLLQAAGIAAAERGLVLPWNEQHTQPLMRWLGTDHEFRDSPLRVVLSPTHRREQRRWPLSSYAQLAERLVREWGAAVMWLYGPGEEALVDEVMQLCSVPTRKAPKTSFREMAALIANMDLFIGNSNGPSHVAVAANIPSLQLHGHTSAISWCPMTDRHRAVQSPEFGQPEFSKVAEPSMQAISLAMVWQALEAMRPILQGYAAEQRAKRPRLNWR